MNWKEKLDDLIANLDHETAEVQALAHTVATDAADIAARSLKGENLETEIGHLKAQALSLTAAAREDVADAIIDFVSDLIWDLLPR